MQVLITLNTGKVIKISIEEWETAGKLKGYCKTNKIKLNQVTDLDFINDEYEDNRSECEGKPNVQLQQF